MNKQQFDNLLKPLIEIYDEIELELILNILKKLDNYNNVQGSLEWYLEKLENMNSLDKENLNVLKKNKEKIKEALEFIVSSSKNIDYLDRLEDYYNKGLIDVEPGNLYNGLAINNLIIEAFKDTQDIMNLINTKAIEGTRKEYKNILNKAYIETASGVYTYTESIRRALKEMAKNGIEIVNYESGKHFSIESVVRRDVITRVNKLVGDIELELAKELETNLVYVDQHLGARTRTKYMKHDYEAHDEWQGKIYMIDGSDDKYDNFYEKTGYGEMLGLKGINCYHDFRPYFEWEKVPDRIDEEKSKEQYEINQQQRAHERKIRALKREQVVYKSQKDDDKLKDTNETLKKEYKDYNNFLKENNLNRDYNREYVESLKKETVKSSYEDVTQEWLNNATPNSHELKYDNYFMDDNGIRHPIKGKEIVHSITKEGSEYERAKWLKETFGGDIHLVPRITDISNEKIKTSTPDFRWNGKKWDLKTPGINGKFENSIERFMKHKEVKIQAKKFIIDFVNFPDKTDQEIIELLKNTLNNPYRNWIEDVILVRNNKLIKIYSKK